jgi:hypothetical protein
MTDRSARRSRHPVVLLLVGLLLVCDVLVLRRRAGKLRLIDSSR